MFCRWVISASGKRSRCNTDWTSCRQRQRRNRSRRRGGHTAHSPPSTCGSHLITRLDHPVRLRVIEDPSRSRLTVFFRFFLTIPHFIWLGIWTVGILIVGFVAWFIVLFKAEMPAGLHRFFAMYIRYATHVNAYLNLAANPFPGFLGEDGYEVDLEIAPPVRQNRWKVGFRFFLAIPALMLGGALGGGASGSFSSGASTYGIQATGVLSVCAVLVWF